MEYPKLLWKGEVEITVHSPEEQAAREKEGFKAADAPAIPDVDADADEPAKRKRR